MNILFTGASSFSGYWFVQELLHTGHNVTAALSLPPTAYNGLRGQRLTALPTTCVKKFSTPFGSPAFMQLIKQQPHWDILCHHAACVRNYKSPSFNAVAALKENTRNATAVLKQLKQRGCQRIVLTGSFFESGEGGIRQAAALSPYGLSKSLTTAYFRYYALQEKWSLGHFVIPNPFGPMEEPRFIAYLMRNWKDAAIANVNTPNYLRDNIHISLLAKAYAQFVNTLPVNAGFSRLRPSGYVETQGEFTRRFAREMRKRLSLPCQLKLAKQTDFNEPMKRINNQPLDSKALAWSEKKAWDDIAQFYRE